MVQIPKKGLRIAHINITSIRNKFDEIKEILLVYNLNVLAILETRLDNSFSDEELAIPGYCLFRKDRNRHGGGVAFFIQDNLPAREKKDLSEYNLETIWLEVHVPYVKPLLIGCCYRPPNGDCNYINAIGVMLEKSST